MITKLIDTMWLTIPRGSASMSIQRRCSSLLTTSLVAIIVAVAPASALSADIDSDFREALDTDGDNVQDALDFDDDNDGILDSHERAALRNDQSVIYVNDSSGNLLSINDPDGSPVVNLIGNSGVVLGDIAMAPDGTLYGIELSTSELYSIDTATGAPTAIGVVPGVSGANALSFDGNGLAYVGGTGSTIQRFDPANIAASTLWHDFGSGSPGGDFVFFEGEAFISWFDLSENFIRRVSLDASNDYVSDQRLGDLPSSSFGLSADVDGNLYVVANGSSGFGLYQFDRPNSPISGEIPNTLVSGTALASGEYFGATSNVESILGAPKDRDGDGIADHRDIDSDNDGITDNVEAQTTSEYIAPSGTAAAITDLNGNGLDDNYEVVAGSEGFNPDGIGLAAVDTDSTLLSADEVIDYLDLDSDNDGIEDAAERGTDGPETAQTDVVSDATTDADGDGLLDVFEGEDSGDGFVVNDENRTEFLILLSDTDGDVNSSDSGSAMPLNIDSDFREALDTDGDNIHDEQDIDDDNDGIPDSLEIANASVDGDSDDDGVQDHLDLDSDEDGIADAIEGHDADKNGVADMLLSGVDSDSDGLDNSFDTDNGGVAAALQDSDTDGKADYIDVDSDGDGISDSTEAKTDNDNDNLPDYLDLDSDGDGITDNVEAFDTDNNGIADVTASGNDTDGDGLDNAYDPDDGGVAASTQDFDMDGLNDSIDVDSDGDGIPDIVEGTVDTDEDGMPDYLDTDSDNDGIDDAIEAFDANFDGVADAVATGVDTDGDGLDDAYDVDNGGLAAPLQDTDDDTIADYLDVDSDGDGITDIVEAISDTDNDGTPNYLDTDSDNDGIDDAIEAFDANYDGVADAIATGVDTDADGLDDAYDVDNGGLAALMQDVDDDAVPDYLDNDSDNDGIPDVTEIGTDPMNPLDADDDGIPDYLDEDSDNDGIVDTIEGIADSDDDGIPDYLDLDSDNDGITDIVEAGGGLNDTDGDGVVDNVTDANGNGIDDSIEAEPHLLPDTDNDGVLDYLDLDSDNDGITDIIESQGINADLDGDAMVDDFVDNDGDGLDDSLILAPTLLIDTDSDGMFDHHDIDADNDGLLDVVEAGGEDIDGDGRIDAFADTDADGTPDAIDADWTGGVDADGDGVDDVADADFVVVADTDGDGIIDSHDVDANGDGIVDSYADSALLSGLVLPDDNGNLIPNYLEVTPLAATALVQTGLSGNGCSVSGEQTRNDPLLLLLGLFSLAALRRSRMKKS